MPSFEEKMSFWQGISVLKNYQIELLCGYNLNTSEYERIFNKGLNNNVRIKRISDSNFESIQSYNKLMLSISFYKMFEEYEFMLIYQLDAWIFKDEIQYWCNQNYDYIGAPWIDLYWSKFYSKSMTFTRRLVSRIGYSNFNLVGNGGFSLRKISSLIFNLKLFNKQANRFNKNEDFFFAFYINSYNPFFKVGPFHKALKFAFEENPDKALLLNNYNMPMGCHAWVKNYSFWKTYINKSAYDL